MKYIETKTKQKINDNVKLKQPKIKVKLENTYQDNVCEEDLHNEALHDFFPNQIDLFFVCKDVMWKDPMTLEIITSKENSMPWPAEYLNIVLSNYTMCHYDLTGIEIPKKSGWKKVFHHKDCELKSLVYGQ